MEFLRKGNKISDSLITYRNFRNSTNHSTVGKKARTYKIFECTVLTEIDSNYNPEIRIKEVNATVDSILNSLRYK